MTNPLLSTFELPPFDTIEAEHFLPALTDVLEKAEAEINQLVAQDRLPDWESFFYPLESINDRIERIWSPIANLNAVRNTQAIRDAYNQCLPLITDYSTRMGQHEGLFQKVKSARESSLFESLDSVQQKVIDDMLRDFKLSGIGLEQDKKQRFTEIKAELSSLTSSFSNNVLDATQAWSKIVTSESELKGMPSSALEFAANQATAKEHDGYLFTLDIPSYLSVMQHCENRTLRKEMYFAYVTRASKDGPNAGEFDNSELMQKILELRTELAQILGYQNYAELSIATKMANSTDEVINFLQELGEKSVSIARSEYEALAEYARDELNIDVLEAWDIAYASEQLREAKYSISQEELKPYFSADSVISGMFVVVNKLYGLSIKEATPPSKWHEDVKFYEVFDAEGELKALFYLDLFAREAKRGGAWMADCQSKRALPDHSSQLPVAFLTCNFTPPGTDKPSLLTHNEVTTLFHEFGHGLHHMLTEIEIAAVAGISGVAWDAVELPSQFMENWCWQSESLKLFTQHYETGDALPEAMVEKLLKARNFQSAMQMVRQLEFALFDFLIHRDFGRQDFAGISETLAAVRQQVAAYAVPPENRFENSFSHIFAGGYAAGYYSYKWAEVLSADAFSMFEERGIFDRVTGEHFKRCILEKGGSKEPADLFREFRGRDATPEALLRHSGIAA